MRVIVAGSRNWTSRRRVFEELDRLRHTLPIAVLISGGARGVDSMGELWASQRKVPTEVFPAKWRRPDGTVDRGAGYKRNAEMAEHADALAVFWDGASPGTKSMIKIAADKGMPTFLFTEGARTRYN